MKKILSVLIVALLAVSIWCAPASASDEYRTWLQGDSRWGSITFGSVGDTMKKSGCAITSLAKIMVHSGSVSSDPEVFNPGVLVKWLKSNGGVTSQGWLVWSKANDYNGKIAYSGSEDFASGATTAQKTAIIKSYIDKGYMVIVSVKSGGHYVAVDKVADNTVYIMDPASNSTTKLFQYSASGVNSIQLYKGPHGASSGGSTTTTYDTTVDPVYTGSYTVTDSAGVNLRKGAGTSYDILTAIPYNTTVTVTKVQNDWGYTSYNGQKGWFKLEFAKMKKAVRGVEVKAPTKLTYTVGEALDTTGMTVTVLYNDNTSKKITSGYTVSGFSAKEAGSCKVYVSYGEKSAVFTVTVQKKAYEKGIYVVNSSDGLNLRKEANTGSSVLVTVPDKTRLSVTEINNNWGKTSYDGKTGWVCLDYATFTQEEVKQTGITATPKQPCYLSGSSLGKSDFTVYRLYSDGSQTSLTDFSVTLNPMEGNLLPITVTDGDFSATCTVQLFDEIPIGDCNFSGKTDASDALAVLKFAVGKLSETTVFYQDVADMNGDGVIDAKDALAILQLAVGNTSAVTVTDADVA